MINDNDLMILQQFLVEQRCANDMFHKVVTENNESQRHIHLIKYSKMLIKYLEVKQKYAPPIL